MSSNPLFILSFLLGIEVLILVVSSSARFKRYFHFIPPVFWMYFLPMLAASSGILDAKSPFLSKATTQVLPVSLVLLLIIVDLRAIVRLGGWALTTFFIGSTGIVLGTVLTFLIFKQWVGEEFWSGFGALSASWTGGSANMIAVKEAMQVTDAVFAPMVIVDSIVPYLWMAGLIALAAAQPWFDRQNRSRAAVETPRSPLIKEERAAPVSLTFLSSLKLLGVSIGVSVLGAALAQRMPVVPGIVSFYTWTIILVCSFSLLLSLTPARRIKGWGAERLGYFLLYFVLTTIGAKATFHNMHATLLLILAGFLIVSIHALILLTAARILRIPLFLVAAASQANVGGVASAPIVAEVYRPGGAGVGLLLAVLGNILGTYIGILTSQLCYWIAQRM